MAHALAEAIHADRRHELLEDRRALAVGDAVEVEERGVGVGDVPGDRMGRDELVLSVRPVLHAGVEVLPGVVEARRASSRQR